MRDDDDRRRQRLNGMVWRCVGFGTIYICRERVERFANVRESDAEDARERFTVYMCMGDWFIHPYIAITLCIGTINVFFFFYYFRRLLLFLHNFIMLPVYIARVIKNVYLKFMPLWNTRGAYYILREHGVKGLCESARDWGRDVTCFMCMSTCVVTL